jgi:hypothetical protein
MLQSFVVVCGVWWVGALFARDVPRFTLVGIQCSSRDAQVWVQDGMIE